MDISAVEDAHRTEIEKIKTVDGCQVEVRLSSALARLKFSPYLRFLPLTFFSLTFFAVALLAADFAAGFGSDFFAG
jgi:hypothetical protein